MRPCCSFALAFCGGWVVLIQHFYFPKFFSTYPFSQYHYAAVDLLIGYCRVGWKL